ncbi:class C sortase [Pseudoflavonifractor sp. An187]|uniref:class C sortase n=1 Tax=Pseudoflavonifractor sp. An187 TaxID=1965578 RepID=UPI000B3802F1|nr:class C sortase [Pseudoflavonifractor sp. An187]
MKRSKAPLLLGLGCVLAMGMMLYPMASNWLSGQTRSQVITEYEAAAEALDNQDTQVALELARDYNRELLEQSCSVAGFSVSGAPTPDETILTALDPTGGGMLATLEIPAINVILPVYYGTQSTTLTAGVGVVEGSSLPVGGEGSHAVLAGHSGLASSRLLSDLDQLTQGDVFFLRVLDETLAYEVDQISVVLPDDVSQIGIDPNGDYVTLLTCTPYGINSHRLLVRGARTEWTAEDSAIPATETTNHESSWWREYRMGLCIGFGIYLAMLAIAVPIGVWRFTRRKKE